MVCSWFSDRNPSLPVVSHYLFLSGRECSKWISASRFSSGPPDRVNSSAQSANKFSIPEGAVIIQCRLEVSPTLQKQCATHRGRKANPPGEISKNRPAKKIAGRFGLFFGWRFCRGFLDSRCFCGGFLGYRRFGGRFLCCRCFRGRGLY